MLNPNWNPIQNPLFRWGTSVERIISACNLPRFPGSSICILSDYGGAHKKSRYQVISVLYVDLENSLEWVLQRRLVRKQYLKDSRRMSFKDLNDTRCQKALIPFLEAADLISGLSVTLVINKSIRNLCINENELEIARESFGLECEWQLDALETALRITYLISLLVAGLSHPKQNIYWISDEDELFANPRRTADLQRLLGKFSGINVKHELGERGMGTTAIDEGDRFEEDLVAIPDLIAGMVSDVSTRLSKSGGGKIPVSLAVQLDNFSTKTDIISSWLWTKSKRLERIVIALDMYEQGKYVATRLNML